MRSIWPRFEPVALSITAALSHKPPPRGKSHPGGWSVQTHRQAGIHVLACTQTLFVYFSHHHTHKSLSLSFFLLLSLSLTHTHSLTSPGIRSFYRAAVCVGVGGGMAVLFHPAQTGSQINILSPAGQLVQAGQTASENVSLWFHVCRLS